MSLSKAIAQVPGIKSVHGPRPQLDKENCLKYHGQLENPVEAVRKRRAKIVNSAATNNLHYVENSWFMSALAEEFVELFPECKIVHLIRDGRDFVRSGINRPWFNEKHALWKRWQSAIGRWNRDKWNPPPECKTVFEKICWLWAEQQRTIEAGMQKIPEKNRGGIVKFEDLIGSKINWFLETINLKADKDILMKKANASSKHKISKWTEWDSDFVDGAKKWMGDTLLQYDYQW
jgi:hypothetical protein